MIAKKHLKDAKKHEKAFSKGKPFPNIVIDGFFDKKMLESVRNALADEEFDKKESDLFQFYQTKDLEHSKNPIIKDFRKYLLSEEFIGFMEDVTGNELARNKISIHGTLYSDTDHLLCHDDQLDDRRLAIMIYLSDLTKKDGGELILYDSKGNKPIEKNSMRITPKFNRFAMFRISEDSFHEVNEVKTIKPRLAIGWWYYDKQRLPGKR